MDNLQIMTCNVNGLGNALKRRQIFRYLHEKKADIIFLQETHSTKSCERRWRMEFGGRIFFDHGTSESRGVAIVIDRNINFDVLNVVRSGSGRHIEMTIKFMEKTFLLSNVYAPNTDNPEFFQKIFHNISINESDFKILGGDLNVHLDMNLDYKSKKQKDRNSKSAEFINSFLEEESYADIWRIMNPDSRSFTWRRRNPIIMSRLDYFIMPLECGSKVSDCQIIHGLQSDHDYVKMSLNIDETIKGRGYWKFNVALLRDKTFVDEMNDLIEKSFEKNKYKNPSLKWELMKIEATALAQAYGKQNAHAKKMKRIALERKMTSLKKKLACINLSADSAIKVIEKTNEKIDNTKLELELESRYATQGAIIRSKSKFYEQGEISWKYFFALEKRNAKMKSMSIVVDDKGNLCSKPNEVLRVQADYYKKLYTTDPKTKFNMNIIPERCISESDKQIMEKPLIMEELKDALKQMKRNKSPGMDGIPADFYQMFFCKMKNEMLDLFKECFQVNRIFTSGRNGIISLIRRKTGT